jgi:DNA-binding transcriptional ArsR family regulator
VSQRSSSTENERERVELASLRPWRFLTNHAEVFLGIARDPEASVVELAAAAQITTRSAYRILADLQKAGYVRRKREGSRNRYELNPDLPVGDPQLEHEPVANLLKLLEPRHGHRRSSTRR